MLEEEKGGQGCLDLPKIFFKTGPMLIVFLVYSTKLHTIVIFFFYFALASPAEYHKNQTDGNNLNGGSNSSGSTNPTGLGISGRLRPSRIPQPVRHYSPLLVTTSVMSETDKSSGMSVLQCLSFSLCIY